MSSLSGEQKELLFDYCIGVASEKESAEAEELIGSSKDAADIHSKLKAALAPLDTLELDSCPDVLAERTIARLNAAAHASELRLQQLLASEQMRTVTAKGRLWSNLGQVAAVAAAILLIGGAMVGPLRFARHKCRCQLQLGGIFQGLHNYISDHDGHLPAVATATGKPWWKVGCQGEENCSNTRNMWLLVKHDYVSPDMFVCPGKKQELVIRLDPSQVRNYKDFPSGRHITFSIRIWCKKPTESLLAQKVLMADLNPLFERERLPVDYSKALKIELSRELQRLMSGNHKRRGQNILFGDGSVKFIRERNVGIPHDDIFLLRDITIYRGTEMPSCEMDTFLAP